MAKRYSFFRIILLLALFVIPQLIRANGGPTNGVPFDGVLLNGGPANGTLTTQNWSFKSGGPDSMAMLLGHCNPVTVAVVNCATQTIELSAFVQYLFTGQLDPVVAVWNTGEEAHRITVVPPGAWSWDPSFTGCEPNHWANTYDQPGSFFYGTIDISGDPLCDNGFVYLDVETDGYEFNNYTWSPPNPNNQLSPYEVNQPGLYSLTVTDDLGCSFTDQFNVPLSPPVVPTLSGPTFLCSEGDTATIQVNQPWLAYEWADQGQTTNSIEIYGPGIYEVVVTNQFGCTGNGFIGIQSGDVDPFSISMTAPSICPGDLDTLRVVGGFSNYTWSNGAFGITNIVNQPGTYSVTVTNVFGCTGTGSVTVGLKPTPTIGLTSTPFCPGDTSVLTVTGGNFPQYTWSNGQSGNPINVTTPGTYSVIVSGSAICPTNTSVAVVQSPAPTIMIAPPAQLNCVAPNTNLNGSGSSSGPDFTLLWTTVGGNITAGQGTLNPTVDAAGTYTLLITNNLTGCTASSTVVVTSNFQPPPAPVGGPATLTCTLTDVNIGAPLPPSDTTLLPTWVATGGGNIVSGQNSWNPNVDAPGTYILTVTNPANSCTSTATVIISEDTALPTSVIAQPSELTCTMSTTNLDGSGSSSGPNFTYLWTTADGTISGSTNTPSTTAASVGTYTLLVTNTLNGCTHTTSVTVTADINIPTTAADPAATLTCDITEITINATGSSSGPTFDYTWTGPNPGSIVAGQGTLQPTVNAPGTYSLLLINNANNCTATLSVLVPQDIVPPVANAGPLSTLNCVIPTLVLDGTASSTGANFTYQWTTADGVIVSGANGLSPTVSMAGSYNLLVTNTSNGCTASSSVLVQEDANAPIAGIANPATLTCLTLETVINALASSQGPSFQYSWTGPGIVSGDSTLQPTVDMPGVYTLSIVNTDNGCTDTQSISVPQDILTPVALAGNDGLINCNTPTGTVGSTANPTGSNFTLQWTTVGGNFTSPTNGPTADIDAAGIYTLLITNTTNGCTDTDVVEVTDDFIAPTVDAGPTFELNCVETSTTLQGTGSTGGNFQYLWTTVVGGNIVSGGTTLTPTVNASGTYNLLITNMQNGCTSSDQVSITQSADVPVVAIATPNLLTCIVTSFELDANNSSVSPTITYAWTASNGGNITNGGTSLTPTINAPGVYTLQLTDAANNCTSVATVTVPQNIENPVVEAGNPGLLTCDVLTLPLGATILSSSSPNISYVWSTTDGTIVSGGNTPTPTIGSIGTYTVVVTDAINGCTHTDNVQIVNDIVPPVASIAQPATLTCVLLQTQINATASSPGTNFEYVWTTNDGNIVNGGTTNLPTVDDPGTYNLLITNIVNGCTTTASIVVPEDVDYPNAEAGNTVGLDCDTQTNALDANASSQGTEFQYTWTTTNGQIISGANTLTPQVGDPGTYTLTIENTLNGCISVDDVLVTEDVTLPSFVIGTPQLLTCVTTSTNLPASGTNFGNAPTFTWATNNGNIVSGGSSLTANVDAPGTYTLTIVNTINGCTNSVPVVVLEDVAPPPVNTQPVPPLTCTVLQQTLTATAPAQALLQWTTQNGNIVSGANSANPVVNEPGTYSVTATLPLNGCTNVATVNVLEEMNVPTGLDFELDPPLCNGTPGYLVVTQIDGGVGPFLYSINGGETFFTAQDIDDLQPGSYDLVIQDANGCEITQVIPVPTPPSPAVDLPPSFSIQLGEDQELQAIVPPAYPLALIDQVIWTPTTGLTFEGTSTAQLLNPVAMPFVTTEYLVTILTKEGCKAESRTIIRVDRDIDIYAPNVIWTDDPDSDNSAFTLFTRQGSVRQILSLQVYDRWGEQLFVNRNFFPDDPSIGWKGDFKGEFVNPGVFVWWAEVELIDGQKILMKGDVTVVR